MSRTVSTTFCGSSVTQGTKLRKMWLQSLRLASSVDSDTSSSSSASSSTRSPSLRMYSKLASFEIRSWCRTSERRKKR